jgi:hypothetical protein
VSAPTRTLGHPNDQASSGFGWAVASPGDVNGDGYADLVVGASRHDASANDEGAAFVYSGGSLGIPMSHSQAASLRRDQGAASHTYP